MDSVFQKLEDIEMTAEAIVEHAEEEKAAIVICTQNSGHIFIS